MCEKLEKCFFFFYPSKPKAVPEGHEDARWFRVIALISTFVHFGLLIFCLALVGPYAMLFNLGQCFFVYSVYLTLREREMAVYLLLLIG